MKRTIIIAVILIAAGVAVWQVWPLFASSNGGGENSDAAAKTETAKVAKGALHVTVEATGRVVPAQEVEIKCKASGEIITLPVDISDSVKKGDLLVQLDPKNEERSVKRAEVALAVSQARLAQAEIALRVGQRQLETDRARAQAALISVTAKARETKAKLDRIQGLAKTDLSSPDELDTVLAANAQADADVKDAQTRIEELATQEIELESRDEDLKIAQAQVQADTLSLSDATQRLADTTITAPIDGVVAVNNVRAGQIVASGINNVSGGTPLITLADLSKVYILVSVDESDIGSIANGQTARITVDAHPDKQFPGEVVRVATKGATTSNVVTFEVKVEVKGPNRSLLKPEMTANVAVTTVDKDNVLLVPVGAVERHRKEQFINVRKADGTLDKRTVTTGATDGENMEITNGAAEGEEVVIPRKEGQSRWRRGEGREGSSARDDIRKIRMLTGDRPR